MSAESGLQLALCLKRVTGVQKELHSCEIHRRSPAKQALAALLLLNLNLALGDLWGSEESFGEEADRWAGIFQLVELE